MKYQINITADDNFYINDDDEQPFPFVGDCLLEIAEMEGLTIPACKSESEMLAYLLSKNIKITGLEW